MSHDTLVVGIEPILFLQVVRLYLVYITYDIYVIQCTMQINAIQCNAICRLSNYGNLMETSVVCKAVVTLVVRQSTTLIYMETKLNIVYGQFHVVRHIHYSVFKNWHPQGST